MEVRHRLHGCKYVMCVMYTHMCVHYAHTTLGGHDLVPAFAYTQVTMWLLGGYVAGIVVVAWSPFVVFPTVYLAFRHSGVCIVGAMCACCAQCVHL